MPPQGLPSPGIRPASATIISMGTDRPTLAQGTLPVSVLAMWKESKKTSGYMCMRTGAAHFLP